MNINSGAFAVIFNEKKELLLIHRTDHDLWEIPGGAWEVGETPWGAIIREVREETGLEVEVERLISLGSRPKCNDLVFTFQCKVTGGMITTTREADKVEYFSAEALPGNVPPSKINKINDALLFRPECLLRDVSDCPTTKEYLIQKGIK